MKTLLETKAVDGTDVEITGFYTEDGNPKQIDIEIIGRGDDIATSWLSSEDSRKLYESLKEFYGE